MLAVGLVSAAPLVAQDSGVAFRPASLPCYHARPRPGCSVFFLTNAGGYVGHSSSPGSSRFRAVADWGVMVNTGTRSAIGGSFFAILDGDGVVAGPAIRYRRWLRGPASLDLALGTPILSSRDLRTGSLYGQVKWNPEHWVGFAVRPELIRRTITTCTPAGCSFDTRSRAQLSAGVEFGWVPGLVLTSAGGGVLAVLAILFAGWD